MAGLRGPVRREPPPQLKGVTPLPGSNDDGDVRAATEGSLVPPGVSGAGAPKDCSKGLGSRFKEPPGPLLGDDVVLDCLGDLDSRLLSAAGIVTTHSMMMYYILPCAIRRRLVLVGKGTGRRDGKVKKAR